MSFLTGLQPAYTPQRFCALPEVDTAIADLRRRVDALDRAAGLLNDAGAVTRDVDARNVRAHNFFDGARRRLQFRGTILAQPVECGTASGASAAANPGLTGHAHPYVPVTRPDGSTIYVALPDFRADHTHGIETGKTVCYAESLTPGVWVAVTDYSRASSSAPSCGTYTITVRKVECVDGRLRQYKMDLTLGTDASGCVTLTTPELWEYEGEQGCCDCGSSSSSSSAPSSSASSSSSSTSCPAPAAPTITTVEWRSFMGTDCYSIRVTWSHPGGADAFNVYWDGGDGGPVDVVLDENNVTSMYEFNVLPGDPVYCNGATFKVEAVSYCGAIGNPAGWQKTMSAEASLAACPLCSSSSSSASSASSASSGSAGGCGDPAGPLTATVAGTTSGTISLTRLGPSHYQGSGTLANGGTPTLDLACTDGQWTLTWSGCGSASDMEAGYSPLGLVFSVAPFCVDPLSVTVTIS